MALSVFDDRKAPPTNAAIEETLGRSAAAWSRLKAELTGESALEEEWAFAGPKFGWSLRLKRGKRVIVYMTPCASHFLASFVLGEKACAAASEAKLPAAILATIADAPKYAEGRGFRIPVRDPRPGVALANASARGTDGMAPRNDDPTTPRCTGWVGGLGARTPSRC